MFNSITGRLSEKRLDSICLEAGGIEWDISVPARSLDDFGELGAQARAFTWLHHYEDGMRLFGFASAEERNVFLELMKVDGIGPKQALRVLSGIRPRDLDAALEADDLAALQRVPGVGPKLAQKMLLTLKGRLVLTSAAGKTSQRGQGEWADVVRALADMGFDRKVVERRVAELAAGIEPGPERERELFRRALLDLSAGA